MTLPSFWGEYMDIEADFELEKETKNTFRYQEVTTDKHPPYIKTLYVQKWALSKIGNPQKIKVTIEAVE